MKKGNGKTPVLKKNNTDCDRKKNAGRQIFSDTAYVESQSEHCTVYRMDFPDGYGRMTYWSVMDGIHIIFNDFHTYGGFVRETAQVGVVEVNHCLRGRYRCTTSDGRTTELCAHDFAVSDKTYPPRDTVFEMGEYYGISLILDLKKAACSLSSMLGKDMIDISGLFSSVFADRTFMTVRNNPRIQYTFSDLYDACPPYRFLCFRLKTAELLLFLEQYVRQTGQTVRSYYGRSIRQTVEEMEQFMTENLRNPLPLDELCSRFCISRTTLRNYFAEVYGETPYAHIRRRRIERAVCLLQTTDRSVSDIASLVGYQNASKFSAAFAGCYGMPPAAYRKGLLPEQ